MKSKKLDELNAIATFGQTAKVGDQEVTPATAKAILGFYEKLSPSLKKNFLQFDAKTMKNIALHTQENKGGIALTPEGKYLLNIFKRAFEGEEILRKRHLMPFLEKLSKKGKSSGEAKL